MKLKSAYLFAGVLAFGALYAVIEYNFPKNTPIKPRSTAEIPTFIVPKDKIGCKAMVDNYCDDLYSDKSPGNLKVSDGVNEYLTLQGQTNNNFDNPWYYFYRARLEQKKYLPKDLLESLERRNFFSKVSRILERPSKKAMELDQSIQQSDLESEVDQMWLNAFDEVVTTRLNKIYPGSYKLSGDETSQDIDFEKIRIKKKLWSDISIALWSRSENWKKVQTNFKDLKKAFHQTIIKVVKDEDLKKQWLKKLDKIQLSLPGKNPATANSECISVSRNAHYYPYLNTLTVCAGYFNGGEQIQTLSHELSHAFDNSSSLIDFQQKSTFTQRIKKLKKDVCTKETFSCGSWQKFVKEYQDHLEDLKSYSTPLYDFNKCLQRKATEKPVDDVIATERAIEIVKDRISDLTLNASFLRITSAKLPMPNGKSVDNPNYMNPCSYSVWDHDIFSSDSDLITLMFFTAAYRCDKIDSEDRLKNAVVTAKAMSEELFQVILRAEDSFSARDTMIVNGYSSPSSERFADRLGSYVVAEYLSSYKEVPEKRGRYLVSSFWLCDKPSLKKSNSDMLSALRDYIFDNSLHADNVDRIKDWFSPRVREQLQCEKDFEATDCDF